MYVKDELKLYCGCDIQINDKITVTVPTIAQIRDFGEKNYFDAVYTLTSVGADLKWQLLDWCQIDYTTIEDYDLFLKLICRMVSSKKVLLGLWYSDPEKYKSEIENFNKMTRDEKSQFLVNPLELVLKDIDLADFSFCNSSLNNDVVLYDAKRDITIDRLAYSQIVDAVRTIHGFKRNNQMPANEQTKMDLIEDARDEARAAAQKPYKSILKPLISALSVKSGQCGDERIWNMNINMFFDNIKRITKIQDAQLLLQGAYSGFASLKGIDKTRLDWIGDI